MAVLFKKIKVICLVLILPFIFGGCYYRPQPDYQPNPPVTVKAWTELQKNPDGTVTVVHKSLAEGGVYSLPDTAQSAANAGRILESSASRQKTADRETVEGKIPDVDEIPPPYGKEYMDNGYAAGDEVGVQFNNLSSYDILVLRIKRFDGSKIYIKGLPTGKISDPIPLMIGEKVEIKVTFNDRRIPKYLEYVIDKPLIRILDKR